MSGVEGTMGFDQCKKRIYKINALISFILYNMLTSLNVAYYGLYTDAHWSTDTN